MLAGLGGLPYFTANLEFTMPQLPVETLTLSQRADFRSYIGLTEESLSYSGAQTALTLAQRNQFSVNFGDYALVEAAPVADYEVAVPAGTPVRGSRQLIYVRPTAACTLTVNVGITIPSDSSFTSKVLTINKLTIVQLQYGANGWMLVTIVGEY